MDPGGIETAVRLASQLVKEVGFPVFVAVYLLVKVNPALSQLTKAITDLRECMQVSAGLTRRIQDPKQIGRAHV